MFRLYALTFLGKFRGTHEQEHHLHESPSAITIPLIVLAILSVFGGLLGIPALFSANAHLLEKFLEPIFAGSVEYAKEHHQASATTLEHSTEWIMMGASTLLIVIIIAFAWRLFSKREKFEENAGIGKVLENKWYIDELYDNIIVKPLDAIASFFKNVFEKNIVDGAVNGVGRVIQYSSRQVRLMQNGQVGSYILAMVLSLIVIVLILTKQTIIVSALRRIF
jgi:NADH-quinone oxidoreductase subunit L